MGEGMWECPSSAIPPHIWMAIDLYWLCHSRISGAGFAVIRNSFPAPGSAIEQSSWLMWSFEAIEKAYHGLFSEHHAEKNRAAELDASHAKLKNQLRQR